LCYLSDKALKWESSYTGLRAFLVLPDLSQRYCSRPIPVGFVLAFLFSAGLLASTFPAAFQKLYSDPQQLVVDCFAAGAEGGRGESNFFHGLGAVVDLEHLLELPARALVCLPP
jgi:hypothetical protein